MRTIIKIYWCYYKHNYFNEMFKGFKEEYRNTSIDEFWRMLKQNSTIDYYFYFELIRFKNNPKNFMEYEYEKSIIKQILNKTYEYPFFSASEKCATKFLLPMWE